MRVVEFLEQNKGSMRCGLPIELRDLIDGRGLYSGSYEVLMQELEKVGLEHVRDARFVVEDSEFGQGRIVLLYVKDLDKYDDFDLKQFAYKVRRLEAKEESLDSVLESAARRTVDGTRDLGLGVWEGMDK